MADLNEISDNFYQYSYKRYLTEMQNSDKPEEHHFPSKSAFYEDFFTKVNAAYNDISRNYPPEVAKYIYQSILFNLDKQSQNPAQNNIIDPSTGSISYEKLEANSKRITEALKAKYPDRFIEINKEASTDSQKLDILSNPEQKKDFFAELSHKYSELKSIAERKQFIIENIDRNFEKLSKDKQTELFDRVDIFMKYEKFKTNNPHASDKDFLEHYPYMTNEEFKESNEDIQNRIIRERLLKDYENHPSDKTKKQISKYDEKIRIYNEKYPELDKNKFQNISEFEKRGKLKELTSTNLYDILDELENSEEQQPLNLEELKLPDNPQDLFSDEFIFDESEKDLDSSKLDNQEDEVADLFEIDISPEDPLLASLLDAELPEEQKKDDLFNEVETTDDITLQIPDPDENTYTNPILSGVQISPEELETPPEYKTEIRENPILKFFKNIRNRFTQARLGTGQGIQNQPSDLKEENLSPEATLKPEDYTQNIEEKTGFLARMKNTALKLIGRNHAPVTHAIDTAENNTPNTYNEQSTFDDSLKVTEEEQEKYGALYKQQKEKTNQKSSSAIQVDETSRTS